LLWSNAAAPLVVFGAVTLGAGSKLNLAMGAPASGVTYLFIQFGALVDNGVVFGFSGQGGFTPTAHENANSLTVTLAQAAITRQQGSHFLKRKSGFIERFPYSDAATLR
jgi:hypothetical protein